MMKKILVLVILYYISCAKSSIRDESDIVSINLGFLTPNGKFLTKHPDGWDFPIYIDDASEKEAFVNFLNSAANTTIRIRLKKIAYLTEKDSFAIITYCETKNGVKILPKEHDNWFKVQMYRITETEDYYEYMSRRFIDTSFSSGMPIFFTDNFKLADQNYKNIIIIPTTRSSGGKVTTFSHNYDFPFE